MSGELTFNPKTRGRVEEIARDKNVSYIKWSQTNAKVGLSARCTMR